MQSTRSMKKKKKKQFRWIGSFPSRCGLQSLFICFVGRLVNLVFQYQDKTSKVDAYYFERALYFPHVIIHIESMIWSMGGAFNESTFNTLKYSLFWKISFLPGIIINLTDSITFSTCKLDFVRNGWQFSAERSAPSWKLRHEEMSNKQVL